MGGEGGCEVWVDRWAEGGMGGWCVRYGWIGGRREKVRGVYRFEFARGGEGVGKGGV